jgi:hypothetical protein
MLEQQNQTAGDLPGTTKAHIPISDQIGHQFFPFKYKK